MDGHRRQTLGAVSPNAMPNRRMSMAPNRVAAKGGMAKARQSVAPPGSAAPARQEPGRHANVRRSGHGKGPVDPRPITDKAWQLRCMKDVIAYVSARGYDKEIDLKVGAVVQANHLRFAERRRRLPPDSSCTPPKLPQ